MQKFCCKTESKSVLERHVQGERINEINFEENWSRDRVDVQRLGDWLDNPEIVVPFTPKLGPHSLTSVSTLFVGCVSLKRPRRETDCSRFSGFEIRTYWSNSYIAFGAFISYDDKFILMILNEFIRPAVGDSEWPV